MTEGKKKFSPNPEQQQVLNAPRAAILVSAAAGTGKTATMTQRIIRRLASGVLEISQALILTFTEAAAAEMRGRIEKGLNERLEEACGPLRTRLLEQQLRLPQAQISTIHAFCLSLIRRYGHYLQEGGRALLAARVETAGEEAQRYLEEALDEVLEAAYIQAEDEILGTQKDREGAEGAHGEEALKKLVQALELRRDQGAPYPLIWQLHDLYGGRQDRELRACLMELYVFLRSLPDYRDFVAQKRELYAQHCQNLGRTAVVWDWLSLLQQLVERQRETWRELRLRAEELVFVKDKKKNAERQEAVCQLLDRLLLGLSGLLAGLDREATEGWTEVWKAIYELGKELRSQDDAWKLRAVRAEEAKAFSRDLRQACCQVLRLLACPFTKVPEEEQKSGQLVYPEIFGRDLSAYQEDLEAERPRLNYLLDLVLELDQRYAARKRAENCIDYGDMEHLAYRLLKEEALAQQLRLQIQEIYVDEYQDTSSLQNAILQRLGAERIFKVGDMKQSIYRFRHANPEYFRQEESQLRAAGLEGRQLFYLRRNYRSRPGVLGLINQIFLGLMTEETAELDYSQQQLEVPEGAPEDGERRLYFYFCHDDRPRLLGSQTEESEELPEDWERRRALFDDYERRELKAEYFWLCRQIRKLLATGVEAGEIAVLARKHQDLEAVCPLLQYYGLDYSYSQEGLAERPLGLRAILALCQILWDGGRDPHWLLLLQQAPDMGRFSPEELMQLRKETQACDVERRLSLGERCWRAWTDCEQLSPGLREKLAHFYERLNYWRSRLDQLELGDFLLEVAHSWNYGLQFGEEQAESLMPALIQLAREAQQRPGPLAQFLERVARSEALSLPEAEQSRGIQLLTWHKSKGLEFDHVFLLGGGKKLTGSDTGSFLTWSEQEGFALRRRRDAQGKLEATLVSSHLQRRQEEAELSEQLRLVYVALTRARQALYVLSPWDVWPRPGQKPKPEEEKQDNLLSYLRSFSSLEKPAKEDLERLANRGLSLLLLSGLLRGLKQEAALSPQAAEADESVQRFFGGIREAGPWQGQHGSFASGLSGQVELDYQSLSALLLAEAQDPGAAGEHQIEELLVGVELDQAVLPGRRDLPSRAETADWEQERLAYSHQAAALHGLKYSVSAIKRAYYQQSQERLGLEEAVATADQDLTVADGARKIQLGAAPPDLSAQLRPFQSICRERGTGQGRSSVARARFSATEEGSILHRAFCYLRPARHSTVGQALEEWGQERRFETEELALLAERETELVAFLASPLAADIARCDRGEPDTEIYREIPFTMALRAEELLAAEAGAFTDADKILVQGVIDLWYRIGDAVCLVDYKTDYLQGTEQEQESELRRRYALQLHYYALAIERELGRPLGRRGLWLSRQGRFLEF